MSCICQYFVHSKDCFITSTDLNTDPTANQKDTIATNEEDNPEALLRTDVSATELAAARAEIWLLGKNLNEARITIENLEGLVKTLMDKQNTMLTEMYNLKRLNHELEEECRLQRDYHAMERNAIIRELHDIKLLLTTRSKQLEDELQKNAELNNAVQDANEQNYLIGLKYLRLKKSLAKQTLSECSNSLNELDSNDDGNGDDNDDEDDGDVDEADNDGDDDDDDDDGDANIDVHGDDDDD